MGFPSVIKGAPQSHSRTLEGTCSRRMIWMTSASKQGGRFPAHCLIACTGTGRSPQGRAPEVGEKEAEADGTTSTRDGRHQWQQSSTL